MNNFINKLFFDMDFDVLKFFSKLNGKFANYIMEFISALAYHGILIIIIGLMLCFFVKTRRMGATVLLSLAISALLTSVIIKPLVQRARPYDTNYQIYNWWLNSGSVMEDSYSFPSGHCTAAMTFALSLFIYFKNKKWASLIFVFPALMACSRMYLMVHFFSDCLFGFLVAGIGVIISYFIVVLLFDKTKGKFNNFINNFDFIKLFNKNKK